MEDILSKFDVVRTEDKDGDTIITVFLKGKEVFKWLNQSNVYFPEDLCWGRAIEAVFESGVKAGMLLAKSIKEEK